MLDDNSTFIDLQPNFLQKMLDIICYYGYYSNNNYMYNVNTLNWTYIKFFQYCNHQNKVYYAN